MVENEPVQIVRAYELSKKHGTKAGVAGELFSMHLERSRGESNKFEPAICIDCGDAERRRRSARTRVW